MKYSRFAGKGRNFLKPNPTILILILADLATDHRCRKIAASVKRLGLVPVILCDKPVGGLGASWSGIDVRVLTRRSHYQGFLRALLEYLLRVTPILLTTSSPVWIIEDGTPLFWAALIGRMRGKRVIYDAREILLETPAIRSRPSRRLVWSLWLGLGEALCGPLLTVSPGFERHYRARNPRKQVRLLPNVPEAVAVPDKPPLTTPIRLIYQGALRPESGLREVLAALAAAPEYDLDVYGNGPDGEGLRAEAQRLGLTDRVRFHGAVPFEALAGPLAAAHIGLHLLEPSCRSFDLTLSNKVFDYMHALAPMLLGDTAAHREFLAREPIGAIPASRAPEAILSALSALRADYPSLVERCLSARDRWHWGAFSGGLREALGTAALGTAPGPAEAESDAALQSPRPR